MFPFSRQETCLFLKCYFVFSEWLTEIMIHNYNEAFDFDVEYINKHLQNVQELKIRLEKRWCLDIAS